VRACDNPFRTECVLRVRYRLASGTWDGLLDRLDTLGRRAAIVGPQGSGKTTLLEDLAPRLRARGFEVRELRLDTETPSFAPGFLDGFFAALGPRDVILFDGAEQMGWLAWSRFERRSRAAAGLVITSHRSGLLPTLLETSTTPDLLDGLVEEILGRSSPELRSMTPALFEKHDGNLREALRELYDHFAAGR
jgi:energy-coupling factor transporter ATP-binding protein EcfA2